MPRTYYLVDGYNVLHAAGLARARYGPGDMERARHALLARLADGLDDAARSRTCVVFDAVDPPHGAEDRFLFRGMNVRFSVETGDADAEIEKLIRQHASPRQLRVVSDDIRLQQAAKRRGAKAVKSDAFLQRIARASSSPAGSRTQDDAEAGSSVEEQPVEDWLDYFGLDDGDAAIEP